MPSCLLFFISGQALWESHSKTARDSLGAWCVSVSQSTKTHLSGMGVSYHLNAAYLEKFASSPQRPASDLILLASPHPCSAALLCNYSSLHHSKPVFWILKPKGPLVAYLPKDIFSHMFLLKGVKGILHNQTLGHLTHSLKKCVNHSLLRREQWKSTHPRHGKGCVIAEEVGK